MRFPLVSASQRTSCQSLVINDRQAHILVLGANGEKLTSQLKVLYFSFKINHPPALVMSHGLSCMSERE